MASNKAIRSNPPAQPQRSRTDHQLKADIFETLRHLNRGYGVSLTALDRLEVRGRLRRPHIFPNGFLQEYRNRTEALRALVNWDLLQLVGEREKQDAEQFGRSSAPKTAKPKRHS